MNLPTATDRGRAVGQLSSGWWARALTGEERAGGPADPAADTAHGGMGPSAGPAVGSIAPPRWAGPPGWAGTVEQAVASAAVPDPLPPMDSWPAAFAVPLQPFVALAGRQLADGAGQYLPAEHADPGLIAATFTAVLGQQLARIAVRTLMAELAAARDSGSLHGSDGRQRFEDFIRRQCRPAGLAALCERYPVLARLLGTATQQATEAGLELLARFAADRAAVVCTLLGGQDPGSAVAIQPGLGDRHRQGRSVAVITFADGRKVIYKPRSIQSHIAFSRVAGWLSDRVPQAGLRTAAALARPGYGWLEFITGQELPSAAAAEDFYRREGVLLAALYATKAADMHCENLIACADQPVLIDTETLFHPMLPSAHATTDDPAAEALAASVLRTALLPYPTIGDDGVLDRSGMGGDPGAGSADLVLDWDPPASDQSRLIRRPTVFTGAGNRPHARGSLQEPASHEAAVLEGFRLGYDAIVRDRPEFTQLIESCAGIEVRVVLRASSGYWRLLDESTQPGLLRDARDRDVALDELGQASAQHPLWHSLVPHELADLWQGDIPLLTSRPGARDLCTSAGQPLPGALEKSGLRCALDTVAAMSEVDRQDQEWIISASLATRRPSDGHRGGPYMPGMLAATAAEPSRLLAAACGLADQIIARGLAGPSGGGPCRVNWLGLELVEGTQWMVLPMGAGLADGYLGVALFLAQLASLTGVSRYAEVAQRAVSAVPRLWDVLAGRPDLLAVIGCGGIEGLGGISYGLARLATLLGDSSIRQLAETAVHLTAPLARQDVPAGWAAGSAGALAAMLAVQAELGLPAAGQLAGAYADRLADLVERTAGRCAPGDDPPPAGFAAGPAGIGWALAQFAAISPQSRHASAAQRALAAAQRPGAASADEPHGWCCGTAGLLVAATCLDTGDGTRQRGLRILDDRPVLTDLSLCHGELGIADAHMVLAAADPSGVTARSGRHRAGLILEAINRQGARCGTPGGVPTPGLLHGLAGIGYGLLRLGFADRVPSVLLLQPTPPHDAPPNLARRASL